MIRNNGFVLGVYQEERERRERERERGRERGKEGGREGETLLGSE